MKKAIIFLTSSILTLNVQAQNSSTASQTVNLNLSNVLDIAFVATGNATGSVVSFTFANISDYTNGKQSADYQIRVRSNKKFNVTVKANSSKFSYSGAVSPAPSMPISILSLMVAANQTGGTQVSPFGSGSFGAISSSSKNLLSNCSLGSNQLFSIKYKANPGFNYPAGSYTVDIVYTATQP